MKKIYISGQITGIENEAPQLFKKAENHLIELGFEVVNPMELIHDHDKSWLNYMRTDLKALLDCDGVYMLKNYLGSRGAMIELNLAINLGLEIEYE